MKTSLAASLRRLISEAENELADTETSVRGELIFLGPFRGTELYFAVQAVEACCDSKKLPNEIRQTWRRLLLLTDDERPETSTKQQAVDACDWLAQIVEWAKGRLNSEQVRERTQSSSEKLAELVRLLTDLDKQRQLLGRPPPADSERLHPAYGRNCSAPPLPLDTDGTGRGFHQEQQYLLRVQQMNDTETKITALRGDLAKESSMPDDPITIKEMAKLAILDENTVRNWGAQGRPRPVIAKRGRVPAFFSYSSLRAWFTEKRHDLHTTLPQDYLKARELLSKMSS